MTPITLLKLGGSLITHKDTPLSVNNKSLALVAESIAASEIPSNERRLIIVHGGGSFGHFCAKKFGLSTSPKKIEPGAVSRIQQSMIDLHSSILRALVDAGKPCCTILAQELISLPNQKISHSGMTRINRMLGSEIVPITFGNVSCSNGVARIISGDEICVAILRSLPVDRLVFAIDVDGIYSNPDLVGPILDRVSKANEAETKNRRYDVTGGIASKIRVGLRVSRLGAEVFYVNGNKPERLMELLVSGKLSNVKSTTISPKSPRRFKNL